MRIFFFLSLFSFHAYSTFLDWHNSTCLNNVQATISNLPSVGKSEVFETSNIFTRKYEYRNLLINKFGLDNHFQGIIYNKENDSYIVSGGNSNSKTGSLFISEGKTLNNRLNLASTNGLWHAGGISRFDNYLLVPLEKFVPKKQSQIQFFEFTNGEYVPKKININIDIKSGKTGSVDAIYSPEADQTYLFAFDTKSIAVYSLKGHKLEGDFSLYKKADSNVFTGSNMKVIQQCSGELYLADLTNDGILPPILNGRDVLKLYKFDLNKMTTEFVLKKKFHCDGYCNFRGAVSLSSEDNKLKIIAAKMYRDSKKEIIKFKTFYE